MLYVYAIIIYITIMCRTESVLGIQCERITAPACQGLGYNMTAMPNLAGHTTQTDAENAVCLLQKNTKKKC